MGAILGAMLFVRMAMEPLVKSLRSLFKAREPWERSTEFHILREVPPPTTPAAPPSDHRRQTTAAWKECRRAGRSGDMWRGRLHRCRSGVAGWVTPWTQSSVA